MLKRSFAFLTVCAAVAVAGCGGSSGGQETQQPEPSDQAGRIVFSSSAHSGSTDIYTMNASGDDRIRVLDWDTEESSPAWSRDRTKIVFASNKEHVDDGPTQKNRADLFAVNSDGVVVLSELSLAVSRR